MRILKFFQLRLDFETFVITGPSTGESTESTGIERKSSMNQQESKGNQTEIECELNVNQLL